MSFDPKRVPKRVSRWVVAALSFVVGSFLAVLASVAALFAFHPGSLRGLLELSGCMSALVAMFTSAGIGMSYSGSVPGKAGSYIAAFVGGIFSVAVGMGGCLGVLWLMLENFHGC